MRYPLRVLLLLSLFILTACGGSDGGDELVDTVPPPSPGISLPQITSQNTREYSVNLLGAEVGTTYFILFTDANGNSLTVEGTVSVRNFLVSDIDLSGLIDGDIEIEFFLVDDAGNQSESVISLVARFIGSGDPVVISGRVTFESVPHFTGATTTGLNYRQAEFKPARGVQVLLLDAQNNPLDSTIADSNGEYSLISPPNTNVRVQANARLLQRSPASWDFSVTDNTRNNAMYTLQGPLVNFAVTPNTAHNLSAGSGWNGRRYSRERTAAPFAILDNVYQAIQFVLREDLATNFPSAELRWSVNNTLAFGNLTEGDIGSSFYNSGDGNIYILGAEDLDADEYDTHVVTHEWGHYFEDNFSRSDSIGGSHSLSSHLDMRVAFSEGLGNALAAMILDDPIYRDSQASRQKGGFNFDIEENSGSTRGWYSESSVQSILYDIFDSNEDGVDSVNDGFSAIFATLSSASYIGSSEFTSIHLFLAELKENFSDLSVGIDSLASFQNITVINARGDGETNDSGVDSLLPIYKTVTVGGGPVEVCSINEFGTNNQLGNRQYITFVAPRRGLYTISVTRASGLLNSDPNFSVHRAGRLLNISESTVPNREIRTLSLSAGNYIVEVYDNANVNGQNSGDVCFDVAVN